MLKIGNDDLPRNELGLSVLKWLGVYSSDPRLDSVQNSGKSKATTSIDFLFKT